MIGTAGRRGRSAIGGRRYARGGPAVLGVALLLAALAGCDGSKSEPPAHAAPSTVSTPSATATAPASPAGTAAPSPSPTQLDPDACAGATGHAALRLFGHRIGQDIIYISAEEGAWDCSDSSTPMWKASGRKHDIRIAETARIAVARPFNSSATAQPVELARFLEQLDTLAKSSADPLVFGYSVDPASGSLVELSQEPVQPTE
ncbi:hypothetical protein [Streptomyces sp. NBC_00102]|uniref:hypothetical protein n=1 Tax=Streptomyces sp. NBC_00102 TaxID=2975652 RepID=UPI002256FA95|nr:hypothetical protein [Streptomyces sp. NBC_00102]MCX5400642.1 hypothetical protein [Streptomyces sp. NBC_00102]